MSTPKKTSERNIKEQIKYCFDVSSDKKLLLQDILNVIDEALITKLQKRIVDCKKELKRLKTEEPKNRIAWNFHEGRRREAISVLGLLGVEKEASA